MLVLNICTFVLSFEQRLILHTTHGEPIQIMKMLSGILDGKHDSFHNTYRKLSILKLVYTWSSKQCGQDMWHKTWENSNLLIDKPIRGTRNNFQNGCSGFLGSHTWARTQHTSCMYHVEVGDTSFLQTEKLQRRTQLFKHLIPLKQRNSINKFRVSWHERTWCVGFSIDHECLWSYPYM